MVSCIFIAVVALLAGYWWSGRIIASIHRYAHHTKVADLQNGPKSAAIYALLHLLHHREVGHDVELRTYALTRAGWKAALSWAVPFALFNERWIAIRVLIFCHSLIVLILLCLGTVLGTPLIAAFLGTTVFTIGAFGCLIAYDLCHFWTHEGGPFPSELHVRHHGRPSGNFGMWDWHNTLSAAAMRRTLQVLTYAEQGINLLPRLRNYLERNLRQANEAYHAR